MEGTQHSRKLFFLFNSASIFIYLSIILSLYSYISYSKAELSNLPFRFVQNVSKLLLFLAKKEWTTNDPLISFKIIPLAFSTLFPACFTLIEASRNYIVCSYAVVLLLLSPCPQVLPLRFESQFLFENYRRKHHKTPLFIFLSGKSWIRGVYGQYQDWSCIYQDRNEQ